MFSHNTTLDKKNATTSLRIVAELTDSLLLVSLLSETGFVCIQMNDFIRDHFALLSFKKQNIF